LAIYEFYYRAKKSSSLTFARAMTGFMFAISGITLVGVGGAALVMWVPVLKAAWGM
jgi:hypothetical protein